MDRNSVYAELARTFIIGDKLPEAVMNHDDELFVMNINNLQKRAAFAQSSFDVVQSRYSVFGEAYLTCQMDGDFHF